MRKERNDLKWFDVTDYGAIGDGKTDDTQAIQKAMDAAVKFADEVFLPPGQYKVSDSLKLR